MPLNWRDVRWGTFRSGREPAPSDLRRMGNMRQAGCGQPAAGGCFGEQGAGVVAGGMYVGQDGGRADQLGSVRMRSAWSGTAELTAPPGAPHGADRVVGRLEVLHGLRLAVDLFAALLQPGQDRRDVDVGVPDAQVRGDIRVRPCAPLRRIAVCLAVLPDARSFTRSKSGWAAM